MRRALSVNLSYVSHAMGVRKVANSISDIQGQSTALAMVPFNRPHMISCSCFIATTSLSCTVNEILSLISQNLKTSCDSEHIPFGVLYHACTSTPVYQSAHEIQSA